MIAATSWLVAGCDDKAVDPSSTITDPSMVQEQALIAFETVGQLTDGIDEIAHGDFSQLAGDLGLPGGVALRGGEQVVVFDSSQVAWVLAADSTQTDETGTESYDVYVWIQYRDGQGNPQYLPDQFTASLALSVDMAASVEVQDGPDYFAFGFDYVVNIAVGGLPDGPFTIAGTGDLTTTIVLSGPNVDNVNETLTMGWSMDLTLPSEGGCPTGTMTVSVENYECVATYDGTSLYAWVLRENGALIGSGVEAASCSVPVN